MINIRPCRPEDATVLCELATKTFIETFAQYNTPEDMSMFVSQTYSPSKQLQEIKDPTRRVGIAWDGDVAAGYYHLKIGAPDPSVIGPNPIEILRLYVDSKHHGKGMAASLMDRCFEIAREEGFKTIWLGVWGENHRAQAFYRKYNFAKVGTHEFVLGQDVQVDDIMVRNL